MLRELASCKPDGLSFSMSIRYFDLNNMYQLLDVLNYTKDDLIGKLFDLSQQNYCIARVSAMPYDNHYWVFLVLNHGTETNIDAKVMEAVMDILFKCREGK